MAKGKGELIDELLACVEKVSDALDDPADLYTVARSFPSSHAYHPASPAPLRAETCSTSIVGFTRRAYSMQRATSNCT